MNGHASAADKLTRQVCAKCGARRIDQQIGLEPDPASFIAALVAVFREVKRVLRPDGLLFCNVGDAYASSSKGSGGATPKQATNAGSFFDVRRIDSELPAKNLLMMPARVAIALQSDGWILRSQMPWVKRSCMPESCYDRPTSAIEYVYMFAKSSSTTFWVHRDLPGSRTQPAPDYRWVHRKSREERTAAPDGWPDDEAVKKAWRRVNLWEGRDYFWDSEAVRMPAEYGRRDTSGEWRGAAYVNQRGAQSNSTGNGSSTSITGKHPETGRNWRNSDLLFQSLEPPHGLITDGDGLPVALDVNPEAFPGSHFATFPCRLVSPLVRAATSERGCCAKCGAPWVRQLGVAIPTDGRGSGNKERKYRVDHGGNPDHNGHQGFGVPWEPTSRATAGWLSSCSCIAAIVPCTVLDCFSGAGTTALVAHRLGRDAISIDLSESYTAMARARLEGDAGMFADLDGDSADDPIAANDAPGQEMADLFSTAAD
jgi:SAM-dependent methyltransferase